MVESNPRFEFATATRIIFGAGCLKEFKPEVGFEFEFIVEHEGTKYHHLCRVTEVIPQRKIAYTWRYKGEEGDSLVTFELFAEVMR